MTDHTDLLEQSFELNLNNYGPEDVERLNDWAINAYAALEAAQAEIERQTHIIQGLWMERDVMRAERDAALARLAEIERQEPVGYLYDWVHSSATGRDDETYTGFTKDKAHAEKHDNAIAIYAAAGASPVEPKEVIKEIVVHADYREMWRQQLKMNQQLNAALSAQPPAPSDTAITYMTGYSDGKEWAGATNKAQPERAPLSDAEIEQAVKTHGVCWTGYREDKHGFYTIPILMPYHYQFARAIEAAHGIGTEK